MATPKYIFKLLHSGQWVCLLAAVVIAGVIVWDHQHRHREAVARVREHNHVKMESTARHIEQHLGTVQMKLRFISRDDEVVKMTDKSHDYIKGIYEEDYEQCQLSEVYVIQRDFDGRHRPFMTFEHGDDEHEEDERHSLQNEREEYRVQLEHIRRFAEDPSLNVLVSQPSHLCVGEAGLVMSVPIRSKGELVGIVAGMIPSSSMSETLELGNYSNMVVLANERGDFFTCEDLPEGTKSWFEDEFRKRGVPRFFENKESSFPAERYLSLWMPLELPGRQKWFLAFMYDEATYLQGQAPWGVEAMVGWGTAGLVLLFGGAMFLVCGNLARRLVAQDELQEFNETLEQRITKRTMALKESQEHFQRLNQRLTSTASEIKGLMRNVVENNSFATRFVNPSLRQCWEVKGCGHKACPIHGRRDSVRCWEITGTLCKGQVQGRFAQKLGDCRKCEVYQAARNDSFNDLGETFNEMIVFLADRQQALAGARLAAEAANKAKTEFLMNMSHEIRTPMTAILGFTDVLADGLEEPESIEAAEIIKRNGEHLLEIIGDILDLSKIEAGRLEAERVACPIRQLVADVESVMKVRADAKGLPLSVEHEDAVPKTIQTDPTRLRQILANVVGNAIKFTKTGSVRVVTRLVSSEAERPRVRFDVIDTGIGMTQEQVEMLFEPFTQSDYSTTREHQGLGLGLAISKRLVEMLGGDITVTSELGNGSTFSVTVEIDSLQVPPAAGDADAQTPDQVNTMASESDPEGQPTSKPMSRLNCRILLAEDGPDNQRLISLLLKKAGADVTVAENGQIAHDLALAARDRGIPFDLILMDMQMPVMDGYEATGLLRQQGYTGVILALTAHAMAEDRQKCLDAGCDDYVRKPIQREAFLAAVRRYVGNGKPVESASASS